MDTYIHHRHNKHARAHTHTRTTKNPTQCKSPSSWLDAFTGPLHMNSMPSFLLTEGFKSISYLTPSPPSTDVKLELILSACIIVTRDSFGGDGLYAHVLAWKPEQVNRSNCSLSLLLSSFHQKGRASEELMAVRPIFPVSCCRKNGIGHLFCEHPIPPSSRHCSGLTLEMINIIYMLFAV